MRFLLTFLLTFATALSTFAQSDSALVEILVTDFSGIPKPGEKIIFKDKERPDEFYGITGKNGKFDIRLEGGRKYTVKISSIGEDQDYTELDIPALGPGEVYDRILLTLKYEPERVFTLDNVNFNSGKASLTTESFSELNELVELLLLKPDLFIEIHGHTDDVGDAVANQKLSLERARSVKNYLVSKQINADRISARGFGETRPIASNDTEEGRKLNRRTEVRIIQQ